MKQKDSGDKRHQMFLSKGKHIKNVFEPDRSRALSLLVKKSYFSMKVSKRRAAHPTPSTEHETGYLPISKHHMCSKARCNPSCCPQTAASSMPMWPLRWPHSHLFKKPKLRLDGTVTSQWSQPLERPCLHCSKRVKMKSCLTRERGKGGVSEQ